MSTTQIIATIRQLPITEQRQIAHAILKNTEAQKPVNETLNSDAFDFWQDEREDIYQDYLKPS